MALSDAWLKANSGKARSAVEEVADRDGLSVRVSPKGKSVFQLRYRYDGQSRRLDLGSYPAFTLKTARSEAQRLKGDLEQGHDPKGPTSRRSKRSWDIRTSALRSMSTRTSSGGLMMRRVDAPV